MGFHRLFRDLHVVFCRILSCLVVQLWARDGGQGALDAFGKMTKDDQT